MSLTYEQRQYVKRVLDGIARERARRETILEARNGKFCSGCGGESDGWTAGCQTCRNRASHRYRRGDYPGGEDQWKRDLARNRALVAQDASYVMRYSEEIRARVISAQHARRAARNDVREHGDNSAEKAA